MNKFKVDIHKSILEIPPETWDQIAAGRGFQSHRWYTFGERVMQDSPPTYILASDGDKPIAGAALFQIKNEPLPSAEGSAGIYVIRSQAQTPDDVPFSPGRYIRFIVTRRTLER